MTKQSKKNKVLKFIFVSFLVIILGVPALVFLAYKTGNITFGSPRDMIWTDRVTSTEISKEMYESSEYKEGVDCESSHLLGVAGVMKVSNTMDINKEFQTLTCKAFLTEAGFFYWFDNVRSPDIERTTTEKDHQALGQLLVFEDERGVYSVLRESYDYPLTNSIKAKSDGHSVVVSITGWENYEKFLKIEGK